MDLFLENGYPNCDSDPLLLTTLDSDLAHSFNDPIAFLSPIFDFDATNQLFPNDNIAINSNPAEPQSGCLRYEPVSKPAVLAPHSLQPVGNYDCFAFDLNKFNESLLAPLPSPPPSPSLSSLMEIPEDQFYKFDSANHIDLLLTSLPNQQLSVLTSLPLSSTQPVLNTLENVNHETHASPSESLSSLSSLSSPSSFSSSSISSDSNLSPLPSSPEVAKKNVKKRKREMLDDETAAAVTTASLTVDKAKQLRKREQNRQASIRYRQKKKTEFENLIHEEKQLSQEVQQLQSKIDKMKIWVECFENLYQEMSSSASN